MAVINSLQTLLPELKEACEKATTHSQLRATYTSFKRRIDCLGGPQNDKAREIYWENKRRIFGKDYDFDVLPWERKNA